MMRYVAELGNPMRGAAEATCVLDSAAGVVGRSHWEGVCVAEEGAEMGAVGSSMLSSVSQ